MSDILYMVVPCYNEEEVLPETAKRLKQKLIALISAGKISDKSRILFVDDGSRDKTWNIIALLHDEDKIFSGLKLSRNRGHQNALLAGLTAAMEKADFTISIDADLQDDIEVIDSFVSKYCEGCDIVYGVRDDRKTDTAFKRGTAQGYYKLMEKLGVDMVYNHADYRLMSKRALEGLAKFGEVNLFLRAIVPQIGYKTDIVTYSRGKRFAGISKYPFKKMLEFAWDGITSFSIKPIRYITITGIVMAVLALIFGAVSFVLNLAHNSPYLLTAYDYLSYFKFYILENNSATRFSIWFTSGLKLTAIGIVGEYVGKGYIESKARPRFIVEEFLD